MQCHNASPGIWASRSRGLGLSMATGLLFIRPGYCPSHRSGAPALGTFVQMVTEPQGAGPVSQLELLFT